MKRLLICMVICSFGLIAHGQERVNREKVHFTHQSEVLLNATGWAYNETLGEWIDYKNLISDDKDYKTKYKSLCESPYMKSRCSNFNSIQVKTFTYNGAEYVCLIVNAWRGAWKYPAIREDWYEYKVDIYYFLSKKEYDKLFALSSIITEIQGWSEIQYEYNSEPAEDFVISAIKKKKEKDWWKSEQETVLQVYKATDGSIRFLFESPNKYFAGIEKKYFETTEKEWVKLKIAQD